MGARPRLSIPRRVFLAFALVLAVSGLVSVASLVQHDRTAGTLGLLHQGYLPLVTTLSEARATQRVFNTLLDRVLLDRDTAATRRWLDSARRARLETLGEALATLDQIEHMPSPDSERGNIDKVRRELGRVRVAVTGGDERYDGDHEQDSAGHAVAPLSGGAFMEATRPVLRRCGRTPRRRRPGSSPEGFTVAGQRRTHTGLRFTHGAGGSPDD